MRFDRQPVLHGEHLTVRPLREADFEALYAVASDPLIWEQHPEPNRYRREVFTRFFEDALASGGALAVLDAGEVIGSSRFHGHDEERSEVEIGWTFLARSCWGGPVNRELKTLMVRHALRYVDRVVFLVGHENHRSQRALAKIGAVPAGTRLDGAGQENLLFELRHAPGESTGASGSDPRQPLTPRD